MEAKKGVTKELPTFLSWGQEKWLGFNTIKILHKTVVTKIWCKLCSKHKDSITGLKGAAINSAQAFIEGTNVVTKHNVSFLILVVFLFY